MKSERVKVGYLIAQAGRHGIYTQRETIGAVSDAVMPVDVKVNGQRTWTLAQAELVVTALLLQRNWGFTLDEIREMFLDRQTAVAAIERIRSQIDELAEKLELVGAA